MPVGISSTQSQPSPSFELPHGEAIDHHLAGKRVVVMGLGHFGGGIGSARWLARQDARVLVTDLADRVALKDSIAQLSDLDIDYHLGGHGPGILDDADLIVISPAVAKERSTFFREIQQRGIAWTTEINLFLERCPAKVIGVTGSAGKSTTAAMIHACLRACEAQGAPSPRGVGTGRQNRSANPERDGSLSGVYLGGNIGTSLLCQVGEMSADDTVVLELSSFQLADLPRISRRPDIAVIVNVWPHHLDRHGSFETYLDCKLNMIRGAREGTPVVVGFDDPSLVSKVETAGRDSAVRVVRASDVRLGVRLRVPGAHNELNGRCAATACGLAGVEEAVIRRALESFTGLPHRLQFVGCYGGVDYYNDSKATSAPAAAAALRSFDQAVVVLVGGKAKEASCDELVSAVIESSKSVICFGSGGDRVYEGVCRLESNVDLHRVAGLGEAVALAGKLAAHGDVVLLSPGFESFDEFTNYAHRGETFAAHVHAMVAARS